MKRIKDYRTKKEKEKVEEKEPTVSFTPENNKIPLRNTGTLNQQQKRSIETLAKTCQRKTWKREWIKNLLIFSLKNTQWQNTIIVQM